MYKIHAEVKNPDKKSKSLQTSDGKPFKLQDMKAVEHSLFVYAVWEKAGSMPQLLANIASAASSLPQSLFI